MAILRTEEQVDGLEILKLIIETANFYRAMANLLDEENLYGKILTLAKERETFIAPFQEVVELLGELPAIPDPEKELVQEIGSRLTQLISSDSNNAILDKCLHKDEELADLVNHTALAKQSVEFKTLLHALSDNLVNSKQTLLTLKN